MVTKHVVVGANGAEVVDRDKVTGEGIAAYGDIESQVNIAVAGGDTHHYYGIQGVSVSYEIEDGLLKVVVNDARVERIYSPVGWVHVDNEDVQPKKATGRRVVVS